MQKQEKKQKKHKKLEKKHTFAKIMLTMIVFIQFNGLVKIQKILLDLKIYSKEICKSSLTTIVIKPVLSCRVYLATDEF